MPKFKVPSLIQIDIKKLEKYVLNTKEQNEDLFILFDFLKRNSIKKEIGFIFYKEYDRYCIIWKNFSEGHDGFRYKKENVKYDMNSLLKILGKDFYDSIVNCWNIYLETIDEIAEHYENIKQLEFSF